MMGSGKQYASRSPWVSGQGTIRIGAAPAPVEGGIFLADHSRIGAEGLPASNNDGVREGNAPRVTKRTRLSLGVERNVV